METLFFCSLVALMMSLFVLGQAEIKKVKESIEELKEMLDGSVPKETVDKLLSEMQQEKNADN